MGKQKKKQVRPRKRIDRSQQADYDYHLPVLLKDSVDFLASDPNGIYIDGTLGGGGHSNEILSRLGPQGRLYSFDKDEEAIEHCKNRFADELQKGEDSRIILVNDCFSNANDILENRRGATQGFLLDLGVSSRQLDESRRGFTYRVNSRLDMKFGSHGKSAEDLLNAAKEEELERILRLYGEEPFSRVIARRLVEKRRAVPLLNTFDLRGVVEEVVPQSLIFKALSRVFQAVRIAVNDELSVLENTLSNSMPLFKKGGRFVVISYHSLEDRIVKNFFRENSRIQCTITNGIPTNSVPDFKLLFTKPYLPNEEEIKSNPRARSAKMRIAEKI